MQDVSSRVQEDLGGIYIDISTIYSTICIDTSLEGFYENKFVLYSNITDCQLSVTS